MEDYYVCISNQEKVISFHIDSSQMCIVNEEEKFVLEAGEFKVYVGGDGPDSVSERLTGQKVLAKNFEIERR